LKPPPAAPAVGTDFLPLHRTQLRIAIEGKGEKDGESVKEKAKGKDSERDLSAFPF
jgi:hypothetical protein